MPFVAPGEAFDLAYLDIERLALEAGPPPGRLCLVGMPGLRAVLICWPPGYGHRARRLRPLRAHHDARGHGRVPGRRRDDEGGASSMTTASSASPLGRMAERFGTDWWNDSCDSAELASAVERGATGATSNPTIVLEVGTRHRPA